MRAFLLVGIIFSLFLLVLGITSRNSAGILSNAMLVGGAFIGIFVGVIWILSLIKEKREREDGS